jgi:hypothetical protein
MALPTKTRQKKRRPSRGVLVVLARKVLGLVRVPLLDKIVRMFPPKQLEIKGSVAEVPTKSHAVAPALGAIAA